MLGSEYALQFWNSSWYIAVIFVLILVFINVIYFLNRRILGFLETENWPELKKLLEDIIFIRKKYRKMYLRLYLSTCIATSTVNDIRRLEQELRGADPKLLKVWALQLGLPYLLDDNPSEMKKYFGEFLSVSAPDSIWIKWNYCFALLLLKEAGEAVEILKALSAEKKDVILRLSTIYMLSPFRNEESVKPIIDSGRTELKEKMTKESLKKELEKQKDNIQMLFLTRIFADAVDWLYDENI